MLVSLSEVLGRSFDFIIVGGGTAGLTLANRLSEDSSVSILVLEAGEAHLNDPILLFPYNRGQLLNNPDYDWAFKTVEQVHANNQVYTWARGKCLGGSSAINSMYWTKPPREHMDAFEELGNPEWNWASFDKYSQRAECFQPPGHDQDILTYDSTHRGKSGPVHTCFPKVLSGIERLVLEAQRLHGINPVKDSSSGYINGGCPTTTTNNAATYERSYAVNTYYAQAAARVNLKVLVRAHVSKIQLRNNDDNTVSAVGVAFLHEGQDYVVNCTGEVCLCAGTIMSPQILERSGIGNRSILKEVGIETKIDLPGVGENIQEHLYTGVMYELEERVFDGKEINTMDPVMYPEIAAKHQALFASGKGVYNLNTTNLAFVPLNTICQDAPKMHKALSESILQGIRNNEYPSGLRKQYELQLRWLDQNVPSIEVVFAPSPLATPAQMNPEKKHITVCCALNGPFSRGTIHITSPDPNASARIDPHLFEQSYDLLSLVETVKFIRKFVKSEPLKGIIIEDDVYPGPGVRTDDQIADWLKDKISTTFHTVGSCSMLPLSDGGVVDPKLKVYHTDNIRVVDLSIVPLHIASHTVSLAYAIAEQAADMIKGTI